MLDQKEMEMGLGERECFTALTMPESAEQGSLVPSFCTILPEQEKIILELWIKN